MTRATPLALALALVAGPAAFLAAALLYRRFRRGPSAMLLLLLAAMAGGAAGAFSSAQPTGVAGVDVVERCAFALVVTVVAAHAQRRALLIAALVVLTAGIGTPASVATAAALGLLLAGDQPPQWARAASGAGIVAGLLGLPTALGAWAGLTAAGVTAVVGIAGLAGLERPARRRLVLASGVMVLAGLVAAGAAAASLRHVPDHLHAAEQATDRGLSALNHGDHELALAELNQAQAALASAVAPLRSPLVRPATAVPVVAQNLDALDRVTTAMDTLVKAVADAAQQGDPTSFVPRNGTVDLTAVDRLAPKVRVADDAAAAAQAAIADSRSPFLLPMAADKLDQAAGRLDEARDQLTTFRMATDSLRGLLGGDGRPRRAFVAFTTPSETRGSGGVLGSFAEFEFADGRVSLVRTGRDSDLNSQGVTPGERTLLGPEGYADTWGRFQPQDTWQNVTASPDFPSVGQVISGLYPQSGGDDVDLVFLVDPAGMAALLQLTGPVTVAGWPEPITTANAVQVLGIEQYGAFDDNDARTAFLAELTRTTFEGLLSIDPGLITGNLDCFADAGHGRHLMAWSGDAGEQALFDRVGIDGALPTAGPGNDVAGVVLNNAAGNKLDWFRTDATTVTRSLDTATADRLTTLTITLTNGAPETGFPDYVLSGTNPNRGAPLSENRTLVSGYTSGTVDQVAVDGALQPVADSTEGGLAVGSVEVVLPVGSTRTVTFTFRDRPDNGLQRPLMLLPDPPDAQASVCQPVGAAPVP